jgi:hypothetical protein
MNAATKTAFEFDGTSCTIKRTDAGFMVTIIEGGLEIDIASKDGGDLMQRANDILDGSRRMAVGGVMAPTKTVLAARAAAMWKCDRIAYVASLASRKIAQRAA